VFGGLSFLAGVFHSVTAVATEAVGEWELRRNDFEELLKQSPELREAVEAALGEQQIVGYLEKRQGFSPNGPAAG